MSNIERVKELAGSVASTLPEDEAVAVLESIERNIGRPLKVAESACLIASLKGRKKYLDKQAGIEPPKFESDMYGSPLRLTAPYVDNDED